MEQLQKLRSELANLSGRRNVTEESEAWVAELVPPVTDAERGAYQEYLVICRRPDWYGGPASTLESFVRVRRAFEAFMRPVG
jgi:hypothetical protein